MNKIKTVEWTHWLPCWTSFMILKNLIQLDHQRNKQSPKLQQQLLEMSQHSNKNKMTSYYMKRYKHGAKRVKRRGRVSDLVTGSSFHMSDARIELTWQRLRRASLCGPFHTSRPNIPGGTWGRTRLNSFLPLSYPSLPLNQGIFASTWVSPPSSTSLPLFTYTL